MAYDNLNQGALFKNDDHEPGDARPNMRGQCKVECPHCEAEVEFWVSAWTKTAGPQARNPGMKFQSLAFTAKEQQPPPPGERRGDALLEQNRQNDFDDDIPF